MVIGYGIFNSGQKVVHVLKSTPVFHLFKDKVPRLWVMVMACSTLYIFIPRSSLWFKVHPHALPSCLSSLNMKVTEILHFDDHKYAVKIS